MYLPPCTPPACSPLLTAPCPLRMHYPPTNQRATALAARHGALDCLPSQALALGRPVLAFHPWPHGPVSVLGYHPLPCLGCSYVMPALWLKQPGPQIAQQSGDDRMRRSGAPAGRGDACSDCCAAAAIRACMHWGAPSSLPPAKPVQGRAAAPSKDSHSPCWPVRPVRGRWAAPRCPTAPGARCWSPGRRLIRWGAPRPCVLCSKFRSR